MSSEVESVVSLLDFRDACKGRNRMRCLQATFVAWVRVAGIATDTDDDWIFVSESSQETSANEE